MAANINNITEADFEAIATAAVNARERGDDAAAQVLDKLARKANASLTNAKFSSLSRAAGFSHNPIKWTAVPSTLS